MGLVANADFSNLTYLASGSGAYARAALAKLNDTVNVMDFYNGVYSSGINITSALNNALASLTYGGIVYIPPGYYVITPTISMPPFTKIIGQLHTPGENDFDLNYKAHGTVIGISASGMGNTACGFQVGMGCMIEGLTFLNSDVTYPTSQACSYTSGQSQQLSMTIANILAQIHTFNSYNNGPIWLTDNEARIKDLLVIGFYYPYQINPTYRWGTGALLASVKAENILFDCFQGPTIQGVDDVSEFSTHHGWQYFTGHIYANPSDPDAQVNSSGTQLPLTANARDVTYRAGSGFIITGHVDGALMTNCFAYNWQTGLTIYASGPQTTVRMKNCGADGAWGAAGSSGAGSVANVVNTYQTVGLFTEGSSEMSVTGDYYTGAVFNAGQFQHSAANINFDVQLLAGICFGNVAYFGSGSKGRISVEVSAGGATGLSFQSGVGAWEVTSYNIQNSSFPANSGAAYFVANAAALANLTLPGAVIDATSLANGVTDNFGRRANGLRMDQVEGSNAVSAQSMPANSALSFTVGVTNVIAGTDAFASYACAASAGGAVSMPGVSVDGFINTNGYVEVTYGNYTASAVSIPAHTIVVRVQKR
jgi:hypothetical protein